MNENYFDSLRTPAQNLYNGFMDFLPDFIIAVIVLVLGWIVAVAVAKFIRAALVKARVDEFGNKLGLDQVSANTGMQMSIAGTVAWLVKWFILIVVFLFAADTLELEQISGFLRDVLSYIPNVIAAAGIMLAGLMLARFLSRVVKGTVQAAGFASADLLGTVTQWAVIVFTILAVLEQLEVAGDIISALYTGFIAMVAIAGGLAFGLGGREHATRVLNKIERDIKS